jgi:hypothetical protein
LGGFIRGFFAGLETRSYDRQYTDRQLVSARSIISARARPPSADRDPAADNRLGGHTPIIVSGVDIMGSS